MALRVARPLRFRLARVLRAGGGDDAKPRWTLPEADYHKYTYQPTIPDKHFNVGHWNYAPITLWLRARRPAMEKILVDSYGTLKDVGNGVWAPVQASVDANLPGFGYKVFGLVGLLLGYNIGVVMITDRTEAWMFLEKMRLYALGEKLVHEGFFQSDAEEAEAREHALQHDTERLKALWETAIEDATQTRSFETLCGYLEGGHSVHGLPKPISWRFSMMPYGGSDPDTQTVGFAASDTPGGNYFLLDAGSTGDYIDRQDNKPNPIRKGRHMYTSAYLPPTK